MPFSAFALFFILVLSLLPVRASELIKTLKTAPAIREKEELKKLEGVSCLTSAEMNICAEFGGISYRA
jgi:hypothetical protein